MDYGELLDSSLAKNEKVTTGLLTSCVKRGRLGTSKCKRGSGLMVGLDRNLCITSGAIVRLVCWCKVDILNNECEPDSKKNSNDLYMYLEMSIKFIFVH